MIRLSAKTEDWPLAQVFRISRSSRTIASVVVVTIEHNGYTGRGECLPYPRYDESPKSVIAQIDAVSAEIEAGMDRLTLRNNMAPGAARNALDCALIDLECKAGGQRAWQLLSSDAPVPVTTAYTLSMDGVEVMAENARKHADRELLKIKLGPDDAAQCVREVRRGAPNSRLIVDANEAWTLDQLDQAMDTFVECKVEMVEQPLPAGNDHALLGCQYPVPLGADESCHTSTDVEDLATRYQVLNIKLDKTGGLTEALALQKSARNAGLQTMVGCMLSTSLSMAPATLLTPTARFVDLDGPLLLKDDREPGLRYTGSKVYPPDSDLWG